MKHFNMAELTRSATAQSIGLKNTPTPQHRQNLEMMVLMLLDPLREAWAVECAHNKLGTPALRVSSGYRGFQLNRAVGGSSTSAHCTGCAVDLVAENGHMVAFRDFARQWLKSRDYDQMISENETKGVPVWIHIGYKNRQDKQRKQQLRKLAGSTKYEAI